MWGSSTARDVLRGQLISFVIDTPIRLSFTFYASRLTFSASPESPAVSRQFVNPICQLSPGKKVDKVIQVTGHDDMLSCLSHCRDHHVRVTLSPFVSLA